MRTSATTDTAETATATVHGSVRLRNGSLARLSLAITYSFAFRRECGCGGGLSGDFTDDGKNNPLKRQKAKGKRLKTPCSGPVTHIDAPVGHLHATRAPRLQKA